MITPNRIPSEVIYPQYTQVPDCTVEAARVQGGVTIKPACLGGVGVQGCVQKTQCNEIAWTSEGNARIAELLAELHSPQRGTANA